MNIFMIEEIYYDCDCHFDVHTEYGYFLTKEDAENFIINNHLEVYGYNYSDIFEEGYRVIEIEPHKTTRDIANEIMNIPRYVG